MTNISVGANAGAGRKVSHMNRHSVEAGGSFDRIARLAAQLLSAPMALVLLEEGERQSVKGRYGSTGDAPIRFNVDVPIRGSDGSLIGKLSVLDAVDRERPGRPQLNALHDMALLASEQMEWRAAHAAKECSDDWYRLFAETARDLFLIVDQKCVIVTANRAAKTLLGYEPAELAGKRLAELVPACPRTSGAGTLDLHAIHKSRERVPVEVSFSDFHGGERMFTAILRDIGDRKRTEHALEQVAEKLRRSVVEKETLLHEVHHRVKNNLQIVSSLLKLQADSLTEGDAVAALRESQQRVLSMAMIHERLYAGKQMAEIEFDHYARELVQQLVYSVRRP